MTHVQSILSELKSLRWTDQQIADRVGVNRVTINKLRNGTASKGETGESILPMLRKLLAEAKRQSKKKQPATRKQLPRTPPIQQTSKSSEDEQVLDSFLDQSHHQSMPTIIESMPKPDDTIRPEIRKIIERERAQNTYVVRQQPLPQVPMPARQQQPLPVSTCAECGIQNIRLFRKTADLNMGIPFIFVCAKCLKRPLRPQLIQQKQPTILTQQITKTVIPWSQVFRRKQK